MVNSIPDFFQFGSFDLYHSNFLGLPIWFFPVFIFLCVEVMENLNSRYRHGLDLKLKKYVLPLYVISLIAIFYYAFLNPSCFPTQSCDPTSNEYKYIAWFCYPKIVGWGWTIFCTIAIIHVVYCMISVLLQLLRDIVDKYVVDDGKDNKKKIIEVWYTGRTLWLVSTLLWVFPYFLKFDKPMTLIMEIVFFVVTAIYLILPCFLLPRYGVKPKLAILLSVFFSFSMLVIMSIGLEAVRVTYALVLPIFILFGRARSYNVKKQLERKRVEEEKNVE